MKNKLTFVILFSGFLLGCNRHPQEPFTGIGVILGVEGHAIKIVKVIPGTPAAKAGLSPGLRVQKIDGATTEGKFVKDCVGLLRGAIGTKVTLELADTLNNKTNTIELIREKVQ